MTSSMSGYGGMRNSAGSMSQGNSAGGNLKEKVPSGYKKGTLNTFTPEQIQLFEQMFPHLSPESYTGRLAAGDESQFAEMEAPAMRQFNELQGGLASRFSGAGMGARRGSGFQNEMNAQTSNFAQDLQSKRRELRRQAIKDLMGMSSELLEQRPQEQYLVPKQEQEKPALGGWGGAIGAVGGGLIGSAIPVIGTAAGATLGSSALSGM